MRRAVSAGTWRRSAPPTDTIWSWWRGTESRSETWPHRSTAETGAQCRTLALDLASAGAVDEVVTWLSRSGLEVDVLVNCAGFGLLGPFGESLLDEDLRMIQLNITSLTALTRQLLPGMLSRRRGQILNVASTAAFLPGPLMAVYYASKAYVLSFTQALAGELGGSGVTVTALCPGPTRTGFQRRAGMREGSLVARSAMGSMAVARAGYAGMKRGRPVVVAGFLNRLLVQSLRFAPRRVAAAVVRRILEKRA